MKDGSGGTVCEYDIISLIGLLDGCDHKVGLIGMHHGLQNKHPVLQRIQFLP